MLFYDVLILFHEVSMMSHEVQIMLHEVPMMFHEILKIFHGVPIILGEIWEKGKIYSNSLISMGKRVILDDFDNKFIFGQTKG